MAAPFRPDRTRTPGGVMSGSVRGLLVSQVGYNSGGKVVILYRAGNADAIANGTRCRLQPGFSTPLVRWGELWGSWWWIAKFDAVPDGRYAVDIDGMAGGDEVEVAPDLLWRKTWQLVAIDQSERRQSRAWRQEGKALGWFDAGAHWQEANSHAALLFGLADVLDLRAAELTEEQKSRLITQILNGADYLALLQDSAGACGALVHQSFSPPRFSGPVPLDQVVLPGDAAQAAAAWARVASVLPPALEAKRIGYRQRARRAMDWVLAAPRHATLAFVPLPYAVPDSFCLPDVIPTPDLAMLVWAALELEDSRVFDLARQWAARQVPRGETDVYGHFRLFESGEPNEPAWAHGVGSKGMGFNNGATFGHNLLPMLRLLSKHPGHADARLWSRVLQDYAYGYFLPGCRANPFGIFPNGYYPGEGFIWFAGLWHGANAIYGNAAALACELAGHFGDTAFQEIAVANLQWIAGLNAGLTASTLKSTQVFTADIPDEAALPAGMIHGVGRRSAGSWMNWRGAICNGFSAGDQFHWDVAPRRELDGPHSLCDEEWIVHAGGWLSGVARCK